MIVKDLKTDLSDAAQEKVRGIVEQAVEIKLQKEMKKLARRLTVKLLITGAAVAGAILLANNSDKLMEMLKKAREES